MEEVKWFAIAVIVLFGSMFAGLSLEKYQVNQCRISSVQAGKSAEDIVKICK